MKTLHRNWNELTNDCVLIALLTGTIGIALKFVTYFNQWVYFPAFPNTLDSAFLIISAGYLAWRAKGARISGH
jgi:hypothetical protein